MPLHYLRIEWIGDIVVEATGKCISIECDHNGDSFHVFFINPDMLNA
jgi:hypothetical protein